MFNTKDTKWHLLCCCHDNNSAAGPVLIKTTIPSSCLNQGPYTPANLMMRVRQYGYHVCSKQDPFSYFKWLKMRIFGFWQKETGANRVFMATTLWVLFGFFYDENLGCQVWKTQILYFQRNSLFSILPFKLQTLWCYLLPNLHNTKTQYL